LTTFLPTKTLFFIFFKKKIPEKVISSKIFFTFAPIKRETLRVKRETFRIKGEMLRVKREKFRLKR
jgi:hypothetical protein